MKYDLKKIMLNAWKNYRRYNISFAEALHRAWLSAKAEEINAERIKRSKEAADVTEDTNTWVGWFQRRWRKLQCKFFWQITGTGGWIEDGEEMENLISEKLLSFVKEI